MDLVGYVGTFTLASMTACCSPCAGGGLSLTLTTPPLVGPYVSVVMLHIEEGSLFLTSPRRRPY